MLIVGWAQNTVSTVGGLWCWGSQRGQPRGGAETMGGGVGGGRQCAVSALCGAAVGRSPRAPALAARPTKYAEPVDEGDKLEKLYK